MSGQPRPTEKDLFFACDQQAESVFRCGDVTVYKADSVFMAKFNTPQTLVEPMYSFFLTDAIAMLAVNANIEYRHLRTGKRELVDYHPSGVDCDKEIVVWSSGYDNMLVTFDLAKWLFVARFDTESDFIPAQSGSTINGAAATLAVVTHNVLCEQTVIKNKKHLNRFGAKELCK